jgi:hypothetical protein
MRRAVAGGLAGVLALGGLAVGSLGPAAAAGSPPAFADFPVEGPFTWGDRFGHSRLGGRTHEGIDLHASKLAPLVAPFDGKVTDIDVEGGALDPGDDPAHAARAGNALSIRQAEWTVDYFHINNDSPGTDDGTNPPEWRFVSQLRVGAWVLAGQHVAFLGDSGNAETTPSHLHLELHDPNGTAVDPEPSVRAAPDIPRPRAAAVAARSGSGHWVLDRRGTVHAFNGAPWLGHPAFGWDIARDLAVMPDGNGYVVLDGWGGLHLYGSARSALGHLQGPYWPGHDVGRAVAVTPDGAGLIVLDAWGGVHRRGSAASLPATSGAYWPGWDIARDVAVMPDGGGYAVLDGWGGLHAAGSAAPVVANHPVPYWQGWDVARAVALSASGLAVFDAWGGLHGRGDLAGADPGAYRPNTEWADVALAAGRAVAVRDDGLQLSS